MSLFVFAFFSTPKKAYAVIPFGGMITKVLFCNDGGIWMTIAPAGASPVTQIWKPYTKTYLQGPPNHPGQWILGLDAGPGVCMVGKVPFFGMVMLMVGDSF